MFRSFTSKLSALALCGTLGSILLATGCGGADDEGDAGGSIATDDTATGSTSNPLWWRWRRRPAPAPAPAPSTPPTSSATAGSCPAMVQSLGFGPCDLATQQCTKCTFTAGGQTHTCTCIRVDGEGSGGGYVCDQVTSCDAP